MPAGGPHRPVDDDEGEHGTVTQKQHTKEREPARRPAEEDGTAQRTDPRGRAAREKSEPAWPRPEDGQWAAGFRLRLLLRHDPPDGLDDQVLAEVHEAVTDSGRSAHELFGDPGDFAAQIAAERIGDAHRGRRDMEGLTPGQVFLGALTVLGALGVFFALRGWFTGGLWLTVEWPGLVGVGLIGCAALLVGAAFALRTAGRPRGMWTALGGAVATVALTGLAVSAFPDGPLFRVPAPAVAVLAALAAVAGWRLPEEPVSRWFTGRETAQEDDEVWLRRLEGTLRGAHGMDRARARAHADEVRAHLAAAPGAGARAQFGPAPVYALRLADGPGAARRSARRKLRADLLCVPLVAVALWDVLDDPDPGSPTTWLLPAAALLWAWSLWTRLRREPRRSGRG